MNETRASVILDENSKNEARTAQRLWCLRQVRALTPKQQRRQRDRGYVGDERQREEIDRDERQDAAVELAERYAEQRMRGKKIQAERRDEHSHRQVDGEDDAEMNLVHTRLGNERDQQRRQDQDRRRRLQHGPDEQQHHIDDQQKEPGVEVETCDRVDQPGRKAAGRDQPRIGTRRRHDDQDLRDDLGGIDRRLPQLAPRQFAIDEARDQDGVDAGDPRGLRGRENAAVDAAQDDHRSEQRPDG